jgi:hypothetical protein
MKLKVKETAYSVKPKQAEGKLVVGYNTFTVKPKPRGVQIYKNDLSFVLKHDRRSGVRIQKQNTTTILKQWD